MRYHIDKGSHYCSGDGGFAWPLHAGSWRRTWKWAATFGPGCDYRLNGVDSLDMNKLVGVSLWDHRKNSIRLGWRHDGDGMIGIYPYITLNGRGDRQNQRRLASVPMHTRVEVSIRLGKGWSVVSCNGVGSEHEITDPPRFRAGYYLRPYFGGTQPAPNSMYIDVECLS